MSKDKEKIKQLKSKASKRIDEARARAVKRIGIVGSRRRSTQTDFNLVSKALDEVYEEGDILVSGGCELGADDFAERIARARGLSILTHHANWIRDGMGAGKVRNTKIAEDSDVLIALPSDDRTGGTEDTIEKYEKLGKTQLILR